ncbi:hypothetical protein FRC01_002393 [Tulasnella sp. 417]|nr:hypothetical protein FRC01_002393 [Tulasnella sp. 417]
MDGPPSFRAAARENDLDVDDLLSHVKGLFRLIDTGASLGASGSAGTTTISPESLRRFLNTLAPGDDRDTKKIDLEFLNRESRLSLIGVYGNKSEIVKLFETCGAITDHVAKRLLVPPNASPTAELRPGIYVFDPPKAPTTRIPLTSTTKVRYVIYWPQEQVWDGLAGSLKARDERVSCIRYLTCLTDQIRCLISPEHERALGPEVIKGRNLIDNEYTILREALSLNQVITEDSNESFSPRLCFGGATQAVVTFRPLPARARHSPYTILTQALRTMGVRSLRATRQSFEVNPDRWHSHVSPGASHLQRLAYSVREYRQYLSSKADVAGFRWVQLLTPDKCLLIVDTPTKSLIWLFSHDSSFRLDRATYELSPLWDRECAIAVDEQTRVIALVIMGSSLLDNPCTSFALQFVAVV